MILIISDYHSREQEVLNLIEKYKPEAILCMGDGQSNDEFYTANNITSVKGNCDTANLDIVKTFTYKNKKIVMTHGHFYDVIFGMNKLYYLAKENEATICFYGHTHIQKMEEYDGITFINPGAIVDGNYCIYDGEEFKFF